MSSNKTPPRTASLVLQKLFSDMQEQGISLHAMADTLQVSRNAISTWRCGRNEPNLVWVEKMAQALGYKLTLEKL